MIQSKEDLAFYLAQDRKALGIARGGFIQRLKQIVFPSEIWRFQKALRKAEYYNNVRPSCLLARILGG